MDETKKAAGLVDAQGNIVADTHLSGLQETKMQETFAKTKRSESEAAVRKGTDAKGKQVILKGDGNDEFVGEDAYKAKYRKEISNRIGSESPDNVDLDGKLTPEALKRVENELNMKLNVKMNQDQRII